MDDFVLPVVDDWAGWGTIFTDVAVWRPAIVRVWSELARPLGEGRANEIEAGFPGTCAVFIVNGAAVIKFFPPMVAGDFAKERTVYRLLDGRVAEMPRLLAAGVLHDRQPWPYLITSFRPGQAWRDARARIPPGQQSAIARALGRRLRAVHDTPIAAHGEWPLPDSWSRLVAARLEAAAPALRVHTTLPDEIVLAATRFLREREWFTGQPRLLHGDLTADHVLVVEEGGAWVMSGLLDWADAEAGDPRYEWVALYFGLCGRDAALLRAVLSGYDPAGRLPDRQTLLAFTLLHRFGAPILGDVLGDGGRTISDLDELARRLFPGLDG